MHARIVGCSEDKMKSFSAHGVAAMYDAPGLPRLRTNHELTVEQAFIEAAEYVFFFLSRDDLHLLANAEETRFRVSSSFLVARLDCEGPNGIQDRSSPVLGY